MSTSLENLNPTGVNVLFDVISIVSTYVCAFSALAIATSATRNRIFVGSGASRDELDTLSGSFKRSTVLWVSVLWLTTVVIDTWSHALADIGLTFETVYHGVEGKLMHTPGYRIDQMGVLQVRRSGTSMTKELYRATAAALSSHVLRDRRLLALPEDGFIINELREQRMPHRVDLWYSPTGTAESFTVNKDLECETFDQGFIVNLVEFYTYDTSDLTEVLEYGRRLLCVESGPTLSRQDEKPDMEVHSIAYFRYSPSEQADEYFDWRVIANNTVITGSDFGSRNQVRDVFYDPRRPMGSILSVAFVERVYNVTSSTAVLYPSTAPDPFGIPGWLLFHGVLAVADPAVKGTNATLCETVGMGSSHTCLLLRRIVCTYSGTEDVGQGCILTKLDTVLLTLTTPYSKQNLLLQLAAGDRLVNNRLIFPPTGPNGVASRVIAALASGTETRNVTVAATRVEARVAWWTWMLLAVPAVPLGLVAIGYVLSRTSDERKIPLPQSGSEGLAFGLREGSVNHNWEGETFEHITFPSGSFLAIMRTNDTKDHFGVTDEPIRYNPARMSENDEDVSTTGSNN
mmetsp:Transcript_35002/g.76560  ORF Transcript_35002/g.76560 Transcript_35002/m.76560 type:complete len:572 (+) Transcript_35002:218-1933(+)